MVRYELAKAAAQDFENIFDFGINIFGLAQAMNYQQGMKKRFEELAENPKLYAAVDNIRQLIISVMNTAKAFITHIRFITKLKQAVFLLCEF